AVARELGATVGTVAIAAAAVDAAIASTGATRGEAAAGAREPRRTCRSAGQTSDGARGPHGGSLLACRRDCQPRRARALSPASRRSHDFATVHSVRSCVDARPRPPRALLHADVIAVERSVTPPGKLCLGGGEVAPGGVGVDVD